MVERRLCDAEMWVRVLPIAQLRKGAWVEKCEKHMVVKGEVDRSAKENGMAIRKRRCDVCGDLIRTIEMTEDQLAHIKAKFEDQNRALRAEMVNYRRVKDMIGRLFEMEISLRREMKMEHEVSEEDQL